MQCSSIFIMKFHAQDGDFGKFLQEGLFKNVILISLGQELGWNLLRHEEMEDQPHVVCYESTINAAQCSS